MRKLIYILSFILTTSIFLYSQNTKTDFYGAYQWSYGMPADSSQTMTGILYPHSAYAEKLLKKRKRLEYTDKEQLVLIKFYAGKQLTPAENIILKKALKKQQKREELIYKYMLDTLRRNARISPELSDFEKKILKKERDTSANLSPNEQKLLKLVHKHLKNIEKIRRKQTLTPQDSALLLKAHSDSSHLNLKEKIKLWSINRKIKRIENAKITRLASQGYATPVKVGTQQRLIQKVNIFDPRKRPSKYIRKLHRLKKKYSLSQQEAKAYNKLKNGVPLTSLKEKFLAQRAYYKIEKYKQKKHKLDQQYFWSLQDKSTIKRHKKHIHKNQNYYRKHGTKTLLQNIRHTLKRLFS